MSSSSSQSWGDWFKSKYEGAKTAVVGPANKAVAPIQNAAPSVTTTEGSTNLLNTAPEAPNTTATGGRRYRRKTKRSKRSKKTIRRRKH